MAPGGVGKRSYRAGYRPSAGTRTTPIRISAVRAALATLAVRAKVPEAEELGLLPFAVGDLAGFHVDDVLRGRALMLRDPSDAKTRPMHAKEASASGFDARMLIAALPGGPAEPDGRGNFARLTFNEIGGIRDVKVTMSEPLRIGGQSGYQTHGGGQGCAHRSRCAG